MEIQSNRRKQKIVAGKFQLFFIFKLCAVFFLALLAIIIIFIIWNNIQFRQGFLTRLPENEAVAVWAQANNIQAGSADYWQKFVIDADVYTFFDIIWKPLIFMAGINFIILIIFGIEISFSVAGPIFKIIRTLEKRNNGETGLKIELRKKDPAYIQRLADLINGSISENTDKY